MTEPRYWHFCRIVDGRPVLRDGTPAAEVGHVERYNGKPVMCATGLHASRRALDAIDMAPGPWIRLVSLGGQQIHNVSKSCATERHIIASADATSALHELVCVTSEAALLLADVDDPVCWRAIEAKRAWMRGECSDADLAAAAAASAIGGRKFGAARAVASWYASWDAAIAASWAASSDAAMAAPRAAVAAAAVAAACDAAVAGACDAARAAVAAASWAAAMAELNDSLESSLYELLAMAPRVPGPPSPPHPPSARFG